MTAPATLELRTAERSPAGALDGELVARARLGDPASYRALYDRWRPPVYRVARSFRELDRDDAEDVVQEAFVRAFRSIATLQDPARFGSWILTIARNRALSRLARRRSAEALGEELGREAQAEPVEVPEPLAGPGLEAELQLVRSLIAELPPGPEKETVHAFYVEGDSTTKEIAERLGVAKSTITMRLERFRLKVKRRLLADVARIRGGESSR